MGLRSLSWIQPWPTGRRGVPIHPHCSFCTETRPRRTSGGTSFRWLRLWRIASRRISSGSVNRGNPISNIGFSTTFGTSSAYVVAHDWGSALAFHLAARRPEFVRGLAFMEFIRPMPTWDDFHADAVETFKKFRTPGVGERMILDGNAFVEGVLPRNIVRKLTEDEMAVYRAPFTTPESRRPTWRFPNELPIAGEPADVYLAMKLAHRALAESSYPKLLFAGDPGALVSPAFAKSFASGLKNCRVVHLGPGLHYVQEDHPEAISSNLHKWLTELEVADTRPEGARRSGTEAA